MTANGPLMYKVRPLYDFTSAIDLPTCMYKMKNVHDIGSSSESCKEENSSSLNLAELEKSQLNILQKLEELKAKVIKLKDDFGVTDSVPRCKLGKFQDIVIKANPEYPPLSVWILQHLLSESMPARLVTYVHSSLSNVPDDIKQLKNVTISNPCQLSLTVIWRNGDSDHELMVDPVHQGLIEGEANIVRYILRLGGFIYDADHIFATQLDDWLDFAHSSIIHGNNKDRQAALRSLNSHLAKSPFLVQGQFSFADVFMWSALVQRKLHQNLPANMLPWFRSLLGLEAFKKCSQFASL